MKVRLTSSNAFFALIFTAIMAAVLPFTIPYLTAWAATFAVNIVFLLIAEVASRAATGEWVD